MTQHPLPLACRIRAIISRVLKCDSAAVIDTARLRGDVDATDLNATDLDIFDLAMAVEDEIDCEIHDADVSSLICVGDLIRLAERLAEGVEVAA